MPAADGAMKARSWNERDNRATLRENDESRFRGNVAVRSHNNVGELATSVRMSSSVHSFCLRMNAVIRVENERHFIAIARTVVNINKTKCELSFA